MSEENVCMTSLKCPAQKDDEDNKVEDEPHDTISYISNDPVDVMEDILVFIEPPNSKLFCPLCHAVFRDPVITKCGHTFCKKCVVSKQYDVCPVDGVHLLIVAANLALAEQIGELYVFCHFGVCARPDGRGHEASPTGCATSIKICRKREHEKDCDFAPSECPNDAECGQITKKDLSSHLLVCSKAKCPHQKYGCGFVGTASDLQRHLEVCLYEALKEFVQRTERQVAELRQAVAAKDEDIGFLCSMLSKLSEKVDTLEKAVDVKLDCVESKLHDLVEDMQAECGTLHNDISQVRDQVTLSAQMGAFDPQQIFKCKGTFVGHQGPVWCLCVQQEYLFSGSSDKTIKVWDTSTTFKCLKTLEGHTGIVLALCVHGNSLFSGSQDCSIMVWDMAHDFERVTSFVAHSNPVCTLVSAANKLFSGSLKIIKVWDVQNYSLKQNITGLNHWVRALAVSQTYLYGGSYQTIKMWRLDDLECVRDLEISGGSVYSIVLTNRHILCGTHDNCIHVWERDTYVRVATLVGHSGTVNAMVALNTPSGTKVFSASSDCSLRVWSMENMICTQTLVRHQGSVACLAMSRGRLFSAAVDSTVKVWQ